MRLIQSHKTFGGHTQFWQHDSKTTNTPMNFAVFIPSGIPKGALIWLSGLTCNEQNFITKAGAQKYLQERQLMVICPDTSPRGLSLPGEHDSERFGSSAGFYVDATTPGYRDHYRMSSYVTDDIYKILLEHFKISPDKISLFGHSMGGHGALTLGLKYPEMFLSVSAMAPVAHPTVSEGGRNALRGYLGPEESLWKTYDATELVLAGHRHPQKILVDQGAEDERLHISLLTPHFVQACESVGQPIVARFQPGYDHSYYFVASFIQSHVDFHAEFLK